MTGPTRSTRIYYQSTRKLTLTAIKPIDAPTLLADLNRTRGPDEKLDRLPPNFLSLPNLDPPLKENVPEPPFVFSTHNHNGNKAGTVKGSVRGNKVEREELRAATDEFIKAKKEKNKKKDKEPADPSGSTEIVIENKVVQLNVEKEKLALEVKNWQKKTSKLEKENNYLKRELKKFQSQQRASPASSSFPMNDEDLADDRLIDCGSFLKSVAKKNAAAAKQKELDATDVDPIKKTPKKLKRKAEDLSEKNVAAKKCNASKDNVNSNFDALFDCAEEWVVQKQYSLANEHYKKAIQFENETQNRPDKLAMLFVSQSFCFGELGRFSNQIGAANSALKYDSNCKDALYNRAFGYFKLKHYLDARQDVEKILQSDPNDSDAQKLLEEVRSCINEAT